MFCDVVCPNRCFAYRAKDHVVGARIAGGELRSFGPLNLVGTVAANLEEGLPFLGVT